MSRYRGLFCLSLGLIALTGGEPSAQDAKAVLQSVAKNIGADNLRCLTYSGSGYIGAVGQNFTPRDDWPRIELASYTKTLNFDTKASREEQLRRQGNNPARGGGGIPILGEVRQINLVSGDYAWTMQGTSATAQPANASQRQLDIWLTPHGFVKAAMAAAKPVVFTRFEGGESTGGRSKNTIVSFTALGKYRVNGTINEQNQIERVQTWIPNPVVGDMYYESVYTNYRDFGTVKYPTRVHHHDDLDNDARGYAIVRGGHHSFDLTVRDVQANACGEPITVPSSVQSATIPPVRVESQRLANGVYFLGGGSHNSVAVEFRDFIAMVEAPLNEERSIALVEATRKLIPNKPISYVVNTHHHFDHSGGLRAFVHEEGSAIVTYRGNREFYALELFSLSNQRTLEPDRLSLYPPEETAEGYRFETVEEKYTLTDGARSMDILHVQNLNHVEGMLVAYLPAEKILIEADMFNAPAAGAPPPQVTAASKTFLNNVRRLKLDVSTLVPIHGPVIPWADFTKIMGGQ